MARWLGMGLGWAFALSLGPLAPLPPRYWMIGTLDILDPGRTCVRRRGAQGKTCGWWAECCSVEIAVVNSNLAQRGWRRSSLLSEQSSKQAIKSGSNDLIRVKVAPSSFASFS